MFSEEVNVAFLVVPLCIQTTLVSLPSVDLECHEHRQGQSVSCTLRPLVLLTGTYAVAIRSPPLSFDGVALDLSFLSGELTPKTKQREYERVSRRRSRSKSAGPYQFEHVNEKVEVKRDFIYKSVNTANLQGPKYLCLFLSLLLLSFSVLPPSSCCPASRRTSRRCSL